VNQAIPSRPLQIKYSDPNAMAKRRTYTVINLDTEEIEEEDYCSVEVEIPAAPNNQFFGLNRAVGPTAFEATGYDPTIYDPPTGPASTGLMNYEQAKLFSDFWFKPLEIKEE
jgi:hypothetical protein